MCGDEVRLANIFWWKFWKNDPVEPNSSSLFLFGRCMGN